MSRHPFGHDPDECPRCGSKDTIFFGRHEGKQHDETQCSDCGHVWDYDDSDAGQKTDLKNCLTIVDTDTGNLLAEVWTKPDEVGKKCSSLIAAAPVLLEALKAVVSVADRETDEFIAARAAIAQAEGAYEQRTNEGKKS